MTAVALTILLVVISILIFCSALFSGVETALFSLKPSGNKSCKAHKIRTIFPGKSASCPECPALGRCSGKRASGCVVSVLPMGEPTGWAHFAVGGRARHLRDYRSALRSNPKAAGAFSAL